MALNAYLRVTGETQGEIKGSVEQVGREDSIMVIGFSDAIMAQAGGRKGVEYAHEPVTITKEIDRSTPLLMHAFGTGETLISFELDFWTPSPDGQEVQHFTIELENARVSAVRHEMLNNKYPENMQHREREHISFVYQKITWTWHQTGATAQIVR